MWVEAHTLQEAVVVRLPITRQTRSSVHTKTTKSYRRGHPGLRPGMVKIHKGEIWSTPPHRRETLVAPTPRIDDVIVGRSQADQSAP